MADYERRLDKLEAAIGAPPTFYVWRELRESPREAAERYVKTSAGGRSVECVLEDGVFVSWQEK